MQYIKKLTTPPPHWEQWFTTTTNIRSYDYGRDQAILRRLPEAKAFLLQEQEYLCAYCQRKLIQSEASIEHVIPKEHSKELSTNYHNLVAVCANPSKDVNDNRLHCDKEKSSRLVTPFIFAANCDVTTSANNAYFTAGKDGQIRPRTSLGMDHALQVQAFIETVNLNNFTLVNQRRQKALFPLLDVCYKLPKNKRRQFWQDQFDRISRIKNLAYRQYLLIIASQELGRY